jgi:arylformamidase
MTKLVDLSHPWDWHTPPWSGYPSSKIYYFQRLQDQGIVSQYIETSLHMGTHIDAQMHITPNGGDIESIPLDTLYSDGVIVDISDKVSELSLIEPEYFEGKVEIKPGDILIYNTGWHRYYTYGPEKDETKYMCMHPGGSERLAEWIVDMKFKWTGLDCGSADHPFFTSIRYRRPDIVRYWEQKTGKKVSEEFPEEKLFFMHRRVFPHNILHVENVGGDIDKVLNKRCKIGAFPWRFRGGEAAMCRVIAFLEDED